MSAEDLLASVREVAEDYDLESQDAIEAIRRIVCEHAWRLDGKGSAWCRKCTENTSVAQLAKETS